MYCLHNLGQSRFSAVLFCSSGVIFLKSKELFTAWIWIKFPDWSVQKPMLFCTFWDFLVILFLNCEQLEIVINQRDSSKIYL